MEEEEDDEEEEEEGSDMEEEDEEAEEYRPGVLDDPGMWGGDDRLRAPVSTPPLSPNFVQYRFIPFDENYF